MGTEESDLLFLHDIMSVLPWWWKLSCEGSYCSDYKSRPLTVNCLYSAGKKKKVPVVLCWCFLLFVISSDLAINHDRRLFTTSKEPQWAYLWFAPRAMMIRRCAPVQLFNTSDKHKRRHVIPCQFPVGKFNPWRKWLRARQSWNRSSVSHCRSPRILYEKAEESQNDHFNSRRVDFFSRYTLTIPEDLHCAPPSPAGPGRILELMLK